MLTTAESYAVVSQNITDIIDIITVQLLYNPVCTSSNMLYCEGCVKSDWGCVPLLRESYPVHGIPDPPQEAQA